MGCKVSSQVSQRGERGYSCHGQSENFGGTNYNRTDNPRYNIKRRALRKFFDSPSQQVNWGGQDEPSEDEIAEAIFDWWISGKPYKQWYADTYMQSKLEFEE